MLPPSLASLAETAYFKQSFIEFRRKLERHESSSYSVMPSPIAEGIQMLDDATMSRMTGLQQTDDARESRRKLTYADFVRFPDDGRRHELIDGEHYVTASPNLRHQIVLQRLNVALAIHLKASCAGLVLFKLDCVFSFFDIVEPDLVIVLNDRSEILTKRNLKGAPSIVVEVLSPSTSQRDRTIKRDLYERQGVREYWMVDAVRNTVTTYRLTRKHFGKPETLRRQDGDTLGTDLLPGFSLSLDELFGDD